MYECFHCGERAVAWDGDFSFEDYYEEGNGVIHECHCTNCGAKITYRVPIKPVTPFHPDYICKHGVCAWKDEAEYKCEGCIYHVPAEESKP